MAASHDALPTVRCDSPPPDTPPSAALGAAALDMTRSLSTTSSVYSATTDNSYVRDSLGSDFSATSRHSSASYQHRLSDISSGTHHHHHHHALLARQSTGSFDTASIRRRSPSRRRGYMRPQGTDFAASARSRESVLSLGSIAHLQYYFARTGLLDGKGGQLARKRQQRLQPLDFSALEDTGSGSFLSPMAAGSDYDSSYASTASSPDRAAHGGGMAMMVSSPIDATPGYPDEEYEWEDEEDHTMLPPTASTYMHREKRLPKPPSIDELKAELTQTLDAADAALQEALANRGPESAAATREPRAVSPAPPVSLGSSASSSAAPAKTTEAGWHEIQGVHILDVMTLAIRAAKLYYTAHEQPDRLDTIKSEKQLRSELLAVMEVLKRMATRGFAGGLRDDEFQTMHAWILGLRAMLSAEEAMEAADAAERASWTWLEASRWPADRALDREHAFLVSLLAGSADPAIAAPAPGLAPEPLPPLPPWQPIDRQTPLADQPLPTPFLAALLNGVRLVQLHNCAVRRSRRRFGTIPTFHTDTQKPYRAADNLRYWVKAAELRWEVMLKVDALGLQYYGNTAAPAAAATESGAPAPAPAPAPAGGPEMWLQLEDAVLLWCRKVREELTAEMQHGGE